MAGVARVPKVLVVPAASPARSVQQLIALAKASPGRLSYSSGRNGSAAHIAFEYFKLRTAVFMLHIPYRGSASSITDLIAGQVDASFTGAPAVLAHVRSGRLRALAVSSAQRLPTLPEVPTMAESGYPGFEADQWYGLVAPAGVPAALAAEGAVPMPGPPQAFGALIAAEIPRWREVVRACQVRPE